MNMLFTWACQGNEPRLSTIRAVIELIDFEQ